MSNLIEASPEEPRGGGGGNRVFVLLALGLAGLLVIGLLLVFGWLLLQRLQPRPGPTPIPTELAGTRAPVGTLPPAAQTATALAPTATATRVVGGPSPTSVSVTLAPRPPNVTSAPGAASPTPGPIAQATASPTATTAGAAPTATPTPSDNNLPSTGIETDMLAIGALMVLLLLIARGFRMALR